ncbi:MAG: hypothetical protein QE271_12005 [Bacteriovoracaceae bacterium]|nr:hypothetical protein [Bacteriovoracaceae bacterium]
MRLRNMEVTKLAIVCFSFLLCSALQAKRKEIREVYTNDREMKTINLTMGRSTILSFTEKPVKVVLGNSTYFNVEFLGNDVTLQPLAQVPTNLFVYTQQKNKYGFQLKVGGANLYDDLVYVFWKSNGEISMLQKERKPIASLSPFSFTLGNLEFHGNKLFLLSGTKTYIMDFTIKNKGRRTIKTDEFQIFVSRNSERLKGQKVVFDKEQISMHDAAKGRLFFPSDQVDGLKLYVLHKKKTKVKNLLKKYL